MGLFSTKDKHEFKPLIIEIEDKPTSPTGRRVMWSIFAFMAVALLWLFLAKIDVVVTARGKVIPQGEVKTLQPIETGSIRSILVREGQKVKAGQTLIEIDPSVTQSDLESKQKNLALMDLEIERLKALIANRSFVPPPSCKDASAIMTQTMLYHTLKEAQERQIGVLNAQLDQVREQEAQGKDQRERMGELYAQASERVDRLSKVLDIIARREYDDAKKEKIEYRRQKDAASHEIEQARSKINELQRQIRLSDQEYRNKLLETLTQREKESTALRTEVETTLFRNAKQNIVSPVDGYVGKLLVHTVGGVVTPAEKLVTVVPDKVPLIVQATVLNQDIGFITKEMEAEVKIDTYDFQKYGLIHGKVKHIADDAIEDEKLGPVYEIAISPTNTTLKGEGKTLPIHAGMSVTAELKVGKRRVIEFFIYPMIRYLDEGLSVR